MSAVESPVVYLDHDGKPEPLSNLIWTSWQACGCMSGASHADQGGGVLLTTEDQARANMRDSKARIQRSIEDGETWRLMTFEVFRTVKWGDCEHIPKWGIPVVEAPAEHVWATTDRWYAGRRTFKRHLVPTESLDQYRTPALCGHTPSRTANSWGADRSSMSDTVTCRSCEKAVRS